MDKWKAGLWLVYPNLFQCGFMEIPLHIKENCKKLPGKVKMLRQKVDSRPSKRCKFGMDANPVNYRDWSFRQFIGIRKSVNVPITWWGNCNSDI